MPTVTIKDIAKEAGVAVSTVSRVLNNHPDVSEATKHKVNEVVKKRNFVPNSNAKHLKQQSTMVIGIFVKGTFNFLFFSILEKIQRLIKAKGYIAVVNYLDEYANEVDQARIFCNEKKPIGIMFLGGNLDNFKSGFSKIKIPAVLVTNTAQALGFENLSSVTTDDQEAAKCLIEHLVSMGHTNIGVIGGMRESSNISNTRMKGVLSVLSNHGIDFDPDLQFEEARYSFESSYQAACRLLEKNKDISAIFAMSDVMAIGTMRAMTDKGLKIPQDISIAGYDGIDLVNYYNPKLTTIRQLQDELAKNAVDILNKQIEKNAPPLHKVLSYELLEGESVKYAGKVVTK
ncbi:LacI family DNA-binding transcriptional regulator [Proteocatella sphenisci]|uniref:LacI family DNA-binding transcriptional regulator n=1 Tax=Proteocatella sphenisci TaxID=181070 RepID=UPI00048C1B25|nr:LacI family DNA-binding transcriptional regulator [Proteocatella sphenisci]